MSAAFAPPLIDSRPTNLMTTTITEAEGDDVSTSSSIMEHDDDDVNGSTNHGSGDLEAPSSSKDDDAHKPLANKESLHVSRVRIVVTLLLITNAVLVLVASYFFLRQQEQQTFESEFESYAQTIADATHYHARSLEETFQSASDITTSYALDRKAVWPFVTIPHFEVRSEHMRLESFTDVVGFAPLVNATNTSIGGHATGQLLLQQWEIYAQYQKGWIAQSYATIATHDRGHQQEHHDQEHHDEDEEPAFNTPWISSSIFGLDHEEKQVNHTSDTIHAPIWQLSPPPKQPPNGQVSPLVNLDLFSMPVLKELYEQAVTNSYSAVSEVLNLDFFFQNVLNDYHYDDQDADEEAVHEHGGAAKPRSVLFQPVYDRHHQHTMGHAFYDKNAQHENPPRVVGLLFGIVSWENYLEQMLPDNVRGIYTVVSNSCGQSYTFELFGKHAIYLGPGDQHDPAFQYLRVESHFGAFADAGEEEDDHHDDHDEHGHNEEDNHDDHNRTRRLQHDDHDHFAEEDYDVSDMNREATGHHNHAHNCHYYMHIYPSQAFRDTYTTPTPWIVSAVVLVIFIITGFVFGLYVRCISHRQKKVMAIATRTNLVVRELFPRAVRDRIMEDAADQAAADIQRNRERKKENHFLLFQTKAGSSSGAAEALDMARNASTHVVVDATTKLSGDKPKGKPIADLYPDCTIFFADIVGFTAWSSKREPSHVFELLESLYGEFDAIAKRRKVFKVETIGDCYVAACGLPTPCANHALVMARFANDCMKSMPMVLESLVPSLGRDTFDLGMRVGLHSGAVTAGVLRGERGRFQLFGDSVNVAARMESNGRKNKIHCSLETADLLIGAGRHQWVALREDKIHAKGKGTLQTYWVDPSAHGNGTSSSTSDDLTHSQWNGSFAAEKPASTISTNTSSNTSNAGNNSSSSNNNVSCSSVGTIADEKA